MEAPYPVAARSTPRYSPPGSETPSRYTIASSNNAGSYTPGARSVAEVCQPQPPLVFIPATTPPQRSPILAVPPPHVDVPVRPGPGGSYRQLLKEMTALQAGPLMKLPQDSYQRENSSNLQWTNPQAIQRFYEIRSSLGVDPDAVNPRSQGLAIWQRPRGKTGGQYHSFEIRDEITPHNRPSLHGDFFVVRLPRRLRSKTIRDLHKINESTWVEPGLQGVECNFIEPAIVTFAVTKMYDQGKISLEEARELYGTQIKQLEGEWLDSIRLENPYAAQTPLRDALERYIMSDD